MPGERADMAMERLLMLELAAGGCAVEVHAQRHAAGRARRRPAAASAWRSTSTRSPAATGSTLVVGAAARRASAAPSQPRVAIGRHLGTGAAGARPPGPVARRPGGARARRRRVGRRPRAAPTTRRRRTAKRRRPADQFPALALARRAADRAQRRRSSAACSSSCSSSRSSLARGNPEPLIAAAKLRFDELAVAYQSDAAIEVQRFRDHVQGLYAAKALKVLPPVADELVLRPLVGWPPDRMPDADRGAGAANAATTPGARRPGLADPAGGGRRKNLCPALSAAARGPANRGETRSDGVVISITVDLVQRRRRPRRSPATSTRPAATSAAAENNQLVLPDPERTISRVHAQVVFRNGRYAIIDRGSNPISVNGRPLGNGQEAFIQPGDEVQIGGYAMRVEAAAATGGAGAADPFADFAGLASTPPPAGAARAGAGAFADPLAGFGAAPPGRAAPQRSRAGHLPPRRRRAAGRRHSARLGSVRARSESRVAAGPATSPARSASRRRAAAATSASKSAVAPSR